MEGVACAAVVFDCVLKKLMSGCAGWLGGWMMGVWVRCRVVSFVRGSRSGDCGRMLNERSIVGESMLRRMWTVWGSMELKKQRDLPKHWYRTYRP